MTPPVTSERIRNRADYDRLRQTFRWECPEHFNFGFDVVDHWAQATPDHLAIHWVCGEETRWVTFSEVADRSSRLARGLADLGLSRGERVLVILPRIVPWWETLIGLFKAGLVAIPGTSLLTPKDIAYRIDLAHVSAIITDTEGAEKVDAIQQPVSRLKHRVLVAEQERPGWHNFGELIAGSQPAERIDTRADEPALVYFTSGTTGMPKMVLHTHSSYGLGHQVTGRFWLDLERCDLHWNVSDTGWAKAAWSSLFGPWSCGASLFVHHAHGKFQPADVLDYLSR